MAATARVRTAPRSTVPPASRGTRSTSGSSKRCQSRVTPVTRRSPTPRDPPACCAFASSITTVNDGAVPRAQTASRSYRRRSSLPFAGESHSATLFGSPRISYSIRMAPPVPPSASAFTNAVRMLTSPSRGHVPHFPASASGPSAANVSRGTGPSGPGPAPAMSYSSPGQGDATRQMSGQRSVASLKVSRVGSPCVCQSLNRTMNSS